MLSYFVWLSYPLSFSSFFSSTLLVCRCEHSSAEGHACPAMCRCLCFGQTWAGSRLWPPKHLFPSCWETQSVVGCRQLLPVRSWTSSSHLLQSGTEIPHGPKLLCPGAQHAQTLEKNTWGFSTQTSPEAVRGVREEAARYNPAPCAPSHSPRVLSACRGLPQRRGRRVWRGLGWGRASPRHGWGSDGLTEEVWASAAPVRGCSRGCTSVPAPGRRCRRDLPSGRAAAMSRSYNDELQYLDKIDKNCWRIKKGFVPNMRVRGRGPGCPGWGSGEGARNRGRGGPGGAGWLRVADGSPRRWRAFSTWTTRWRSWCSRSCAMPAVAEVGPGGSGVRTPWAGRWQNQSVWKSRLRSSSPAWDRTLPCQPDHGIECHVQFFLEHHQGWWLHHLLGNPWQNSITLSMKKFLPMFNPNHTWHSLKGSKL